MRHYLVFLKKEMMESIKTYKLLLLLIVFILFGILNPLAAKLTPLIIESILPAGSLIPIPEPIALDSWAQFFKNINQIGFIVMLLVFSGNLIGELSKGTLINLLTKGLSRSAVILAKFTNMIIIWTLSLVASFFVTWIYTIYLFPSGGITHLAFAVFSLWLYGVFLLTVLIFASTFSNTHYVALITVGLTVVLGILLNLFPKIQNYNPQSLVSRNMPLLTNSIAPTDISPALWVTAGLIGILLMATLSIFRKKQLQ